LQKNRGPTENILHFFSRFSGFSRFFPSQPIAFQAQAAAKTLQNKSYLKSYRRFSVRPAMRHNRRMKVEMTGRNQGRQGPTSGQRQPDLCAQRLGALNGSSAFGRRPESDAGARPPETAIQPRPVAVGTSQYKSVQVNITNKKNLAHLQCKNTCHSRRTGNARNGGRKMFCSHLFAPVFLPVKWKRRPASWLGEKQD